MAALLTFGFYMFGQKFYFDTMWAEIFMSSAGVFFALVRRFSRRRFMTLLSWWGVGLSVAALVGVIAMRVVG